MVTSYERSKNQETRSKQNQNLNFQKNSVGNFCPWNLVFDWFLGFGSCPPQYAGRIRPSPENLKRTLL
ncbi:MAG: hypothetical protein A2351_08840 [Omnitrophica bacterium RIFOXYB12_FULL_50_7]|nr:MAG: hypothetical protein A2351_08840 [Omnitrophica bacterium RIFOXYB12_FULL_50_7]